MKQILISVLSGILLASILSSFSIAGERADFPVEAKSLLEIVDPQLTISRVYDAARDRIQNIEEGAPHLSSQALDKLLLAILEDKGIPLWKKNVYVRRLSDWANRIMGLKEEGRLPPMTEALLQKLIKDKEEKEAGRKARIFREKLWAATLQKKRDELARIAKERTKEKKEHERKCTEERTAGKSTKSPDKITGAFGFTLGQRFRLDCAFGSAELRDGTPMYRFNPESPFRSFKKYYLMVTPITHKIYSIWGVGRMKNDPMCKKELALVISLLKKKYGDTTDNGLIGNLYDYESIDQRQKSVSVKCTGFTDSEIDIRYYDNTLKETAEKERIKQESSKVDASGL